MRTTTRILEDEEIVTSPIILPDDDEFVRRLVRNMHEESCHAGTQILLGRIRENY